MNKFLKGAMLVIPLILGVSPVAMAASSASADLTLSANVPNTCYIASLAPTSLPSNVGGTSASNTTSGAVTISYGNTLADPVTAVAVQSTATYNLSAYCNYASHSVALKSDQGGMVTGNNQATVGAFDHRINYTADFVWGSVHPTVVTSGHLDNANAVSVVDNETAPLPTNANTTLTIVTAQGTNPLVSGTYGDTLRVSLGATL